MKNNDGLTGRRDFLIRAAAAAGGSAIAFGGFARLCERLATAQQTTTALRAVNPVGNGPALLELPPGFKYAAIGEVGKMLSDGRPTPKSHDGMAAFRVGRELRVVRNHEINDKVPRPSVAIGGARHYDESAGGGTTTLVVDPATRAIVRDFVSLSGTLNNCAGGATPWGSWISCEETTLGVSKREMPDGTHQGGFAKPHGYCFEVPASANEAVEPVPLRAMGRFTHEAVAFDARSGAVYETEDSDAAGFYRFLPASRKRLALGGVLQMLAIKGKSNFDTRSGLRNGASFEASWVPIGDPDPESADVDPSAVFKQGVEKGAAIFARLEGAFASKDGRIWFASTNGGVNKGGQIWLYEPKGRDSGNLTLVFESPDRAVLDMPDNICLHPKKQVLFICEDSDYGLTGATPENYVRILTPDGRIVDFAKNIAPGRESSEFAGATFSPDGSTLFVNIQTAGVTVAIWGEWDKFLRF